MGKSPIILSLLRKLIYLNFRSLKKSQVVEFSWQLLQAVNFCHDHNVSAFLVISFPLFSLRKIIKLNLHSSLFIGMLNQKIFSLPRPGN